MRLRGKGFWVWCLVLRAWGSNLIVSGFGFGGRNVGRGFVGVMVEGLKVRGVRVERLRDRREPTRLTRVGEEKNKVRFVDKVLQSSHILFHSCGVRGQGLGSGARGSG